MRKRAEYSVKSYLIFALAAFILFFIIFNAEDLIQNPFGILSILIGFFLVLIIAILRIKKLW